MSLKTLCGHFTLGLSLLLGAACVQAAEYPRPQDGIWIVKDFRFHTGEVLPELKLHYVTVGEPTGEPVLVLHGSSSSSQTMLSNDFAGELFGAGQPLDAAKYFLIIPDAIGSGKSSRPSDGLRMRFPKYSYEDMVRAQYRLVTEHLGIRHLKLVIGQSMGCMHAWMWGETYPDCMSALVPMACQPAAMSGRNWILRRMFIESIKANSSVCLSANSWSVCGFSSSCVGVGRRSLRHRTYAPFRCRLWPPAANTFGMPKRTSRACAAILPRRSKPRCADPAPARCPRISRVRATPTVGMGGLRNVHSRPVVCCVAIWTGPACSRSSNWNGTCGICSGSLCARK